MTDTSKSKGESSTVAQVIAGLMVGGIVYIVMFPQGEFSSTRTTYFVMTVIPLAISVTLFNKACKSSLIPVSLILTLISLVFFLVSALVAYTWLVTPAGPV